MTILFLLRVGVFRLLTMRSFVCKTEESLLSLGGRLGLEMRRRGFDDQLVVLLKGDVGAGKSCFARGCIRAAMKNDSLVVSSPTFVLLNSYTSDEVVVHHLDLYRVRDVARTEMLDLQGMCGKNYVLIEWPDVVVGSLRQFKERQMVVEIRSDDWDCRFVNITGPSNWLEKI